MRHFTLSVGGLSGDALSPARRVVVTLTAAVHIQRTPSLVIHSRPLPAEIPLPDLRHVPLAHQV